MRLIHLSPYEYVTQGIEKLLFFGHWCPFSVHAIFWTLLPDAVSPKVKNCLYKSFRQAHSTTGLQSGSFQRDCSSRSSPCGVDMPATNLANSPTEPESRRSSSNLSRKGLTDAGSSA